jgi:hypothetical protein
MRVEPELAHERLALLTPLIPFSSLAHQKIAHKVETKHLLNLINRMGNIANQLKIKDSLHFLNANNSSLNLFIKRVIRCMLHFLKQTTKLSKTNKT